MKKFLLAMLIVAASVFTTVAFAADSMQEFNDSLQTTVIDTAAIAKDSVNQPVFTEIVGNINQPLEGESILMTIIVPALLGMIISLVTDAFKYIKAGLWNTAIFVETKLKPASIAVAVILGSWALTAWLPQYASMLVSLLGDNSEISSIMFGGAITAVIDNLTKPKKPNLTDSVK